MTIGDLARRDVVTARRSETVQDVATKMRDQNVGSVVVTDAGHAVGIVTDRDVVVTVVGANLDPMEMTAGDVMTEDPAMAHVEDGVLEVTKAMRDNAVRRMPVVDDGRLAGIVTLDDLSRLFVDELDNLMVVVEAESPPY